MLRDANGRVLDETSFWLCEDVVEMDELDMTGTCCATTAVPWFVSYSELLESKSPDSWSNSSEPLLWSCFGLLTSSLDSLLLVSELS